MYCPPGSSVSVICPLSFYCPNSSTLLPCPLDYDCPLSSAQPRPPPPGPPAPFSPVSLVGVSITLAVYAVALAIHWWKRKQKATDIPDVLPTASLVSSVIGVGTAVNFTAELYSEWIRLDSTNIFGMYVTCVTVMCCGAVTNFVLSLHVIMRDSHVLYAWLRNNRGWASVLGFLTSFNASSLLIPSSRLTSKFRMEPDDQVARRVSEIQALALVCVFVPDPSNSHGKQVLQSIPLLVVQAWYSHERGFTASAAMALLHSIVVTAYKLCAKVVEVVLRPPLGDKQLSSTTELAL
jgi:hypothetical protein